MPTIDLSNYKSSLHQASSNAFADGNVFFNTAALGTLEFADATAQASYTPQGATAATTINATAPDQLVRLTGNFSTDGWRAGMKFTFGGSTSNNGVYTIEAISADGLTITTVETSLATDVGEGTENLVAAVTTNALINLDGLRFEAIYAFENQERRLDENLRKFDRWTAGTFKFGGAYNFVNGRTPGADAYRKLIRGSGWNELTGSVVNRIYFGPKGLGAILDDSVPYYQTSQYADVNGTDLFDFTKLGNLDEAFQVFGDGDNGNIDNTLSSHYFSIRTYGQNYGRIDTVGTLGIAELGGYSAGAALNESTHLTTIPATYPYGSVAPSGTVSLTGQSVNFVTTSTIRLETAGATDWIKAGFGVGSQVTFGGTVSNASTFTITLVADDLATNDLITVTEAVVVEGAGGDETITNVQVAPWTGMSLNKRDTPRNETGFTSGSATFTWELLNAAGTPGTLNECVAYLDAIATIDGVVTTGPTVPVNLNGKAYDTWYDYTPGGKIRTQNGEGDGTLGLYIAGLDGTDRLGIVFNADGGTVRDDTIVEYPVVTPVTVELGQEAINDTLAWFHAFLATGYNTAGATTYDDALSALVKGSADNTSTFITGANTFVSFNHDFSTDGATNIIFVCEGDGGVTQQKATITLGDATVSASCIPAIENNA